MPRSASRRATDPPAGDLVEQQRSTRELAGPVELLRDGDFALSLVAFLALPLVANAQRDEANGGGRYVSSRFGWTLTYDPDVWSVAPEDENPYDRFDRIYLTNGSSLISVTSHPDYQASQFAGCVIALESGLRSDARVSDVELVDGPVGSGEDDERAWLTLAYQFERRGSAEPHVTYFECLWFNDVVIAIRQDVPAADYEDEVELREGLLSGLAAYVAASGGRHGSELGLGGDSEEGPTYEPEFETYESPRYGYTVTYDSITWRVVGEDADPDDAYDLIESANSVSYVAVWGDPDYDEDEMADCVADYVGFLDQIEGVGDVEPFDGPDAAGEDDGRAWETVTYVWEFRDGVAPVLGRYFECIWLGDGVTAVVIHEANLVSYEAEFSYREALVDGIEPAAA